MKIILGLGNPGTEYMGTRHNAGTMLIDKISEGLNSSYGWRKNYNGMVYKSEELILVKSGDVFMNESGRLLQGLPDGELWVAHDDLDIKLGEYKIQKGVGPKVHYGVQSVENTCGTKDFWRVRIGVDNRDINNRVPGDAYVLQKFTIDELGVLNKVLDEIIKTNFGRKN